MFLRQTNKMHNSYCKKRWTGMSKTTKSSSESFDDQWSRFRPNTWCHHHIWKSWPKGSKVRSFVVDWVPPSTNLPAFRNPSLGSENLFAENSFVLKFWTHVFSGGPNSAPKKMKRACAIDQVGWLGLACPPQKNPELLFWSMKPFIPLDWIHAQVPLECRVWFTVSFHTVDLPPWMRVAEASGRF